MSRLSHAQEYLLDATFSQGVTPAPDRRTPSIAPIDGADDARQWPLWLPLFAIDTFLQQRDTHHDRTPRLVFAQHRLSDTC